jgi:hypothetical protein
MPVGIAAGIVLIRLPSLSEPPWASDDGFFTAVAVAMSKGAVLYAGVYDDQPPVIYWLYRLLVAMGLVHDHLLVQLTATVAVVVAALLTYAIARRVSSPAAAAWAGSLTGLVLSIPTLDGDLLNVELVALPLFLGSLLLAFGQRPTSHLAAGLLLGLALATRPSFAVDSLALAVPLLGAGDRVRRVLLVGSGLLITAAAVATALWLEGSLAAYVTVVLPSDHAYLAWSNGGTLVPLITRLGVLAAAGLAVFTRCRTPATRLATVWLFASLAGSSLTPRELSHYVQEAVPALAFTVSLVAVRLRWRALVYPLAAVSVVVAAEAVLYLPATQTTAEQGQPERRLVHYFAYTELPAYYANWLEYATGARSRAGYMAWFPGGAGTDAKEAERLSSLTSGSQVRMIVLGDRPWLFVDSGALPGSRFLATNSAFWQVAGSAGELNRRLSDGCADVVVYQSGPGDWSDALLSGGYRQVESTPWPIYTTTQRSAGC